MTDTEKTVRESGEICQHITGEGDVISWATYRPQSKNIMFVVDDRGGEYGAAQSWWIDYNSVLSDIENVREKKSTSYLKKSSEFIAAGIIEKDEQGYCREVLNTLKAMLEEAKVIERRKK